MMKVVVQKDEQSYILAIEGDLDASSSITLDMALAKAIEEGEKVILFDCQQLQYISSAGLGVFMSYLNEFEEKRIFTALFGMTPKVKNVFEILGLDQLLLICEHKQAALMQKNATNL